MQTGTEINDIWIIQTGFFIQYRVSKDMKILQFVSIYFK